MVILNVGSRGEQVKQLQTALNRAGAELGIKLTVDGVYGSETKTAVMKIQRVHGLSVDGIAGPATQNLLEKLNKPTNTQLYNAFNTCLDAIEDLPEFKTLSGLLE